MRRLLLLAALSPLIAQAQIALFAVNGSTETPLGANYDLGRIATGDTKTVVLRARNTAGTPVQVTTLSIAGAGFTLPTRPSVPFPMPPGGAQDITVQFTGTFAATYSANFQFNSASVLLLATVVPFATVSASTGCAGPDPATGGIGFGTIVSTATAACIISLRNDTGQSLSIATLSVSGAGFGKPQGVQAPLTLPAGQSVSFTITFAPPAPGLYSGTLTVDVRTFPLSATAIAQLLAAPAISYDAAPLGSDQQRNLSMSLPSPAPADVAGNVTLSFTPDTSLVHDDPTVLFAATGTRSLPFTVRQGSSQILLNGQPSAVFQTGTTSGRIRVSLSSNLNFQSDPTVVLTIPPSQVVIDTSIGSIRTASADIQLIGYDNTYSVGPVSFTFYDTSGKPLSGGTIKADFSSAFQSYFSKAQAGGMFKALISFPANGDVTQIGAVDIQVTNSAGTATLQRLTLPPCQLNGLTCVAP